MSRRQDLDALWGKAIADEDMALLSELMLDDFEGFCAHLVWIKNRKNKPIRFDAFNRCQRVALWMIRQQMEAGDPVRQVWLKCRQVGFSTLAAIFMGWRTAIHGENSLIALHEETPGKRVFDKVETMLMKLPDGLLPPTTETEKGTLRVYDAPLESVIRRDSAEKIEIGVGETFQNIALSDAARFKNLGLSKADLIPTIPDDPDTAIIEESTAKGAGDEFHTDYVAAANGDSEYMAGFFPWYWHTEEYVRPLRDSDEPFSEEDEEYRAWVERVGVAYPLDDETWEPFDPAPPPGFVLSDEQLNWRRFKLRSYRGNVDRFREQYPATADEAFVAGEGLVVGATTADKVAEGIRPPARKGEWKPMLKPDGSRPFDFIDSRGGKFWMWDAQPAKDAYCVISADTSSGTSVDPSALEVWDCSASPGRMEQVAEWVDWLEPHEFAKLLYVTGHWYGRQTVRNGELVKIPAMLAIERNHHGTSVISSLLRMRYPTSRIYKHHQENTEYAKQTAKYGWPTSWTSKIPMVEDFAGDLAQDIVRVRSSRLLGEVRSFVWKNGQKEAGATNGAHDDLFMASAVGAGAWRRQPQRAMKAGGARAAAEVAAQMDPATREAGAGMAHRLPGWEKSGSGLVSSVTGY